MRVRLPFPGRKIAAIVATLLGLTVVSPRPASAQWAVFDASSWTMMSKVWSQDVNNFQKLKEEVEQATKIYNNGVQIYTLAQQEASFIRNKELLQAAGYMAYHATIPGHPEWDAKFTTVGGLAAAGTTWQQMATHGFGLRNRINLADSFGTSMLNTLGNCYAAAARNDGKISALESIATSTDPSANTRATQANIGNMSSTQALRIQECQHNLQMQQAKLQMLNALEQRDRNQSISDLRAADAATRANMTVSDTSADLAGIVDR
jgi:hypothetical protein